MRELRHAIICAAGRGERLAPLTDSIPKPLLPIDGVPVLVRCIAQCVGLGIDRITVVVGHLGAVVEAALRDARIPGGPQAPDPYRRRVAPGELTPVMAAAEITVVYQPRQLGTGDAVRCAIEGSGGAPPGEAGGVLVMAADTLIGDEDLAGMTRTFTQTAIEDGGPVAVVGAVERSAQAIGGRSLLVQDATRLVEIVEKPSPADIERRAAAGPLASAAPCWVLGEAALRAVVDASAHSERGTVDVPDALSALAQAGEHVAVLSLARTRDLTGPDDLLAENFPYLEWLVPGWRSSAGPNRARPM